MTDIKEQLIAKAKAEEFDLIRITKAGNIADAGKHLEAFVSSGYHGDMSWLKDTLERRKNPKILWPEVRSIIMLGVNYGPKRSPLEDLQHHHKGTISVYARGKDYHDIIKKRLKRLARWLHQETEQQVKVFVDTAPVMEKPLAQMAGLGWQGKHTNLVSRKFGSWLFLGSIFTTADLAHDTAEHDHCGSCRKCLDICPTKAFPKPYVLDARRCLAYLSIEHKGHIAEEFRKPMGNRIFGCDDCLAVCPWNKYAQLASESRFAGREDTSTPLLEDLLSLDEAHFRKRFAGTPVKRTGWVRFLRNVLIAAGNSKDKGLIVKIRNFMDNQSALVRAMAVWAQKQLMTPDEFATLKAQYLLQETDHTVRLEWEE